ncbi:TPA: hypothetical protein JD342_04980 [Citrobacter freundii]|nr:hypothetical protein [Citrobacter freundii]
MDVVLINVINCLSQREETAVFLSNSSGICSWAGTAKNSFSIYRLNAVSLTASGAQFKRL